MANAMRVVHTDASAGVQDYIKLLASFGKTLPSTGGPGMRQPGVTVRNKLPNQSKMLVRRPSGRPPAEHIVKLLARHVTSTSYKPKTAPFHVKALPVPHPGKPLVLKNVKAIHITHPASVKKVAL